MMYDIQKMRVDFPILSRTVYGNTYQGGCGNRRNR